MEASMATTVDLFQDINNFLAERKESSPGGGWAPVTQIELEQLRGILDTLIELKYEHDADHDLPLRVTITNRTMFKMGPYSPIYHNKPYHPYTEAQIASLNLTRAISNMSIAAGEVKLAKDMLDMYNTGNPK
jgi:hypothetical protein